MEIDFDMRNRIFNNTMHPIRLVQPTRLLNKRYSQVGCKEIIILIRKDQEVKPIGKVDGNIQKEKLVIKSIDGNESEVDDYQD